jgi:hypothetical protein
MKLLWNLILGVAFGFILYSGESEAAHQTVNIRLSGKYCGLYQVDLAKELNRFQVSRSLTSQRCVNTS